MCLLSKDDEYEFPDTGHIRGRVEDGDDDTQTLSVEIQCLELLGFQMTLPGDTSPMCLGQGTIPNGFIDSRVFAMWGVRNYNSDVWGSTQKTVQEDKKLLSSPESKSTVSQAIKKMRWKTIEKKIWKHFGVCRANTHQLKQIEATRVTRIEIEVLTSPLNILSYSMRQMMVN